MSTSPDTIMMIVIMIMKIRIRIYTDAYKFHACAPSRFRSRRPASSAAGTLRAQALCTGTLCRPGDAILLMSLQPDANVILSAPIRPLHRPDVADDAILMSLQPDANLILSAPIRPLHRSKPPTRSCPPARTAVWLSLQSVISFLFVLGVCRFSCQTNAS